MGEIRDELIDKGIECFKEVGLYTPSGAIVLHEITAFLPTEITHVTLIVCCPAIVIAMKHRRLKRERQTEREEAVATE